jgi:hypothetical protein
MSISLVSCPKAADAVAGDDMVGAKVEYRQNMPISSMNQSSGQISPTWKSLNLLGTRLIYADHRLIGVY